MLNKKKAEIARCPIGIFAFLDGELLYYKLFSSNPVSANEEFSFSELKVEGYEVEETKNAQRLLRKNMRDYALSLSFAETNQILNKFLSDFAIILSRKRMKSAIGRDKLIIHASNAHDDITKIQNLLLERLREWYFLHYPELKQKDPSEMILKYGRRENFPGFKDSTGVELKESDEKILHDYANTTISSTNTRKQLEKYIEESMREICPNISSVVDPLLGARIMALAGSLERLAKMTASTIQLIGAEKALFRHMHQKGKPPKHGIIFADARIQNAENKGKTARIISSKIMMAARIDFYSGRYEENLKKDLAEDLKKVRK